MLNVRRDILDPTNPPRRGLFSLVFLLLLVILLATLLYVVILGITRNMQTAKEGKQETPYTNPFAPPAGGPTPTVYQNPFVTPAPTYTNPFSTLQGGGESGQYDNPFEKLR